MLVGAQLADQQRCASWKTLLFLTTGMLLLIAKSAYSQVDDEIELFYDTEEPARNKEFGVTPIHTPVNIANKKSLTKNSEPKTFVNYNGYISHLGNFVYFVNGKPLGHWQTAQLLSVSTDRRRLTVLLAGDRKVNLDIGINVEGLLK